MNGASQAANKYPTTAKVQAASGLVDSHGNSIRPPGNYSGKHETEMSSRRPETLDEYLDEKIARQEQYLYDLKITKEKMKELKFRAGDVARHSRYGNVLITNVFSRAIHQETNNIHFPDDSFFVYEINYMNRGSLGPSHPDRATVPPEELFPITELAETLFR